MWTAILLAGAAVGIALIVGAIRDDDGQTDWSSHVAGCRACHTGRQS